MASYIATVASTRSPDEAFAYIADFRSVAEWDPTVRSAVQVNDGDPLALGAIFRVTVKTALSEIVLDYQTIELQRPDRIVLRGENNSMVSLDTIVVRDDGRGGAEVTYDAKLELKGARKLADPLLGLAFKRLGNRARDGLRDRLNPRWHHKR
jgi:Polyketide cyclase / dehydrase and lipid transport